MTEQNGVSVESPTTTDVTAESSTADVTAESSTVDISSLVEPSEETLELSEQSPVSEDVKPQTEIKPEDFYNGRPLNEHPRWKEKQAEVEKLRAEVEKYKVQPQAPEMALSPEGEKSVQLVAKRVLDILSEQAEAQDAEVAQKVQAISQKVGEIKQYLGNDYDAFIEFGKQRLTVYPGASLDSLFADWESSHKSTPVSAVPSGKPMPGNKMPIGLDPDEDFQTMALRLEGK